MKLPDIKGRKKIRDFRICRMYMQGSMLEDIARTFNITIRRISAIIYNNRNILVADATYEKAQRIHWLKRQIAKDKETKKDTAELIEQLRKEIEGDKPLVDVSQHKHFHITVARADGNNLQVTRQPTSCMGVGSEI
jgi:hypothetical protein